MQDGYTPLPQSLDEFNHHNCRRVRRLRFHGGLSRGNLGGPYICRAILSLFFAIFVVAMACDQYEGLVTNTTAIESMKAWQEEQRSAFEVLSLGRGSGCACTESLSLLQPCRDSAMSWGSHFRGAGSCPSHFCATARHSMSGSHRTTRTPTTSATLSSGATSRSSRRV